MTVGTDEWDRPDASEGEDFVRDTRRRRGEAGAGEGLDFSDDALAREFTRRHGDELRYVAAWGRWKRWTGRCWVADDTLKIFALARAVCHDSARQCPTARLAQGVKSAATIAAVERLARADRAHAAVINQWDADDWLLNTPGGQVDLRDGTMDEHEAAAYCSKITSVAPGGEAPLWAAFLDRVTGGDRDLKDYLQRAVGYSATGLTREHALFFLHGTGANGKSVFIRTIAGVLGNYHTAAPASTFMASKVERHPTELANLPGPRLVSAVEIEEGARWAESRVLALTGGDVISARYMRQDLFEFVPRFKLWIVGNHKPGLRGGGEAMRRRLHLIPFNVMIPELERDDQLAEKLRGEWSGVLAWIIAGAREWAAGGLRAPVCVRAATDDYLAAQDRLALWIEECCTEQADAPETVAALYASWETWAKGAGEYAGSKKRFSQMLGERGFEAVRLHGNVRGFRGLVLSQSVDHAEGEL